MFDWQVTKEEEAFPALLPGEAPAPRRWVQQWRWVAGIALVLAVAVVGTLRWRVGERESAIREDLIEFITMEERARLFGLREEIDELLVPEGVPEAWREAYEAMFSEGDEEAEPLSLAVEEVTLLDEQSALVTVRLDEQEQLRHYRFIEDSWRRAPIAEEVWGTRDRDTLANGVIVVYSEQDLAFAQALIRDLPALFEEVRLLGGHHDVRAIEIRPTELGPAVLEDGTRIVLNSPQLLSPGEPLHGDEAVRYALAKEVLSSTGIRSGEGRIQLGGRLFRAAAREVVAFQWALGDESLARLGATWQEQIGDRWPSPLFSSQFRRSLDPFNPDESEAAMLWMVNHFYETEGATIVAAIFNQVAYGESWDDVFRTVFSHLTMEVEAAVADATGVITLSRVDMLELMDPISNLQFPLTAEAVPSDSSEERAFEVEIAGLPLPVTVEAEGAEVLLPDGSSLPGACAPLFKQSRMEGEWIEQGRRLAATRITLEQVGPAAAPQTEAPPSNTIAYAAGFNSFPWDSQPDLASLLALDDTGATTPIATLNGGQLFEARPALRQPQGSFLIQYGVEGCDRHWLFLYEPEQGITGYWLTPATPYATAAWALPGDTTDEILLVLQAHAGGASDSSYMRLRKSGPTVVAPMKLQLEGFPIALRSEEDQALIVDWNQPHEIRSVELTSGEIAAAYPTHPGFDPWSAQLINEGSDLLYLVSSPAAGGVQRSALHKLDLATGEDVVLLEPEEGRVIYYFVASSAAPDPLIGLIVGAPYSAQAHELQLLTAAATAGNEPLIGIPFEEGEAPVGLLPCSDGSFLLTLVIPEDNTEAPREIEIRLWRPDGEIVELYWDDDWVYPWACR